MELSQTNEQQSTLIQLGHGDPGDHAQVTEESGMHLRPQHPLQQPGTSAAPPEPMAATSTAATESPDDGASLNVEESKPRLLSQPPLQQPGKSTPSTQMAAAPSMEPPEQGPSAAIESAESNATRLVEDSRTSTARNVPGGQVLSVPLESSSGDIDLLQQSRESASTDSFTAENNRGLFAGVLPVQSLVEPDPVGELGVPPLVSTVQAAVDDLKQHGIPGVLGFVASSIGQRDVYAYIGPLIFGTLLVCSLVFYMMSSCGTNDKAGPSQPSPKMEVPTKPVAARISLGTPLRRSQMNLYAPPSVTTIGNPLSHKNLAGIAGVLPSLCSELVVPEENECSLLLPRVFPQAGELSGQVSIDDVKEMSVFHAVYYLPGYQPTDEAPPPRAAKGQRRRLILRSAVDDLTFAYCCDAPLEPGCTHPGYTIFDHEDQAFGTLRPAGPNEQLGFRVRGRGDYQVAFLGDMQVGNVNATDEQGRLLAISEAINASIRCIRIGPQVDAGFMTLTMLAIDLLRYDIRLARRTPTTPPHKNIRAG